MHLAIRVQTGGDRQPWAGRQNIEHWNPSLNFEVVKTNVKLIIK